MFSLKFDKPLIVQLTIRISLCQAVTKDLDILKQLFENLSDTDKQDFLTSVSQKE